MIRRFGIAICLSLALFAPACKGTENVMGTPLGGPEGRTLQCARISMVRVDR